MQHNIPNASDNLRDSLKRLYRPEHKYGVPHEDIKRFMDEGHLDDRHKEMLTSVLFPHLVFDPVKDRFVSRTITWAILSATAHIRALVQDYPDKSELARRTGVNFLRLDAFVEGQKDLSPDEKQQLADVLGIHRAYDRSTDSLIPLPATSPPMVQPPDYQAKQSWRDVKPPTQRSA